MWNDRLSRINHALDSILSAMISAGFSVVLVCMLAEAGGLIA
jgi:hypothetical protein